MNTVVVISGTDQQPAKAPPIYTVTVMKRDESRQIDRQRTWGWYSKFEDAQDAVLSNATDMFECNYYNIALIEEVPEGILALAEKRWWFKATYNGEEFNPAVAAIEPPEWAEGIVNYSMG